MRAVLWGAAALWAVGIALVALSVGEGGATVSLWVIVPIVTGSSLDFLLGVGLMVAGIVVLMLAVAGGSAAPEAPTPPPARATPSGTGAAGGFVLIGPVPIVFGSWRGISRRDRWLLVVVGAVLLIAVALATAGLVR